MARPPLFVLDASVAVKWYVEEPERDRALQLRAHYVEGKIDLAAPRLLTYEVGNALRFHPNATETLSGDGVKALEKMQIMVAGLADAVLDAAMRIAYRERISFYDAAYVALADHTDGTFITADEQLASKLTGDRHRVLLLRDYGR